jgi:hypothetical protein
VTCLAGEAGWRLHMGLWSFSRGWGVGNTVACCRDASGHEEGQTCIPCVARWWQSPDGQQLRCANAESTALVLLCTMRADKETTMLHSWKLPAGCMSAGLLDPDGAVAVSSVVPCFPTQVSDSLDVSPWPPLHLLKQVV